ncbi:MAG TPA: 2,3-bisphosphoglycerate-independent phosphoglycerate mutase [Rhodospirillaceae bacterium]|nr:MAG: phosphoglycerate mutase (2,3-diphosphoglycerate-independent) [Alphaproteobacteria bacterium GWF2_58_20]HAU29536.1 2,3-bisphosphoglycerate-independent phosphoglycerate mutase [Rhodospirillaceae bacterium]
MSGIRPVVLCILDGFGWREEAPDNATTVGKLPNFRRIWAENPHAFLQASGIDVGLPEGQMGNSEVGHLNIGSGRIVMQDLPKVDHAVATGEIARNPVLRDMIEKLKTSGGACHLMGLLSPGGVHSHQRHMLALCDALAKAGVPVRVHAFLDGRDVPPQSAAGQVAEFMQGIAGMENVRMATIGGRYYGMDRDKRWDRVEKAYKVMTQPAVEGFADPVAAIESSYAADVHDEFVLPVAEAGYEGMKDGDAVLMANFRADRAREILSALLYETFDGFDRGRRIVFVDAVAMAEYSADLTAIMHVLFPSERIENVLGAVVADAGLKQLRIAETEKYPHVTFFFNGGEEKMYEGEDRILVPSPKVATYDLQPEMSAIPVTDKLVEAVGSGIYDLVVVNFANPDMVGHTGILEAAIKAVETVDACLGRLEEAVRKQGGALFVTADHGNCEKMYDETTHGPHTAHTTNQVPAVLLGSGAESIHDGRLCDIAPTLLEVMAVSQPVEMTGKSLINHG